MPRKEGWVVVLGGIIFPDGRLGPEAEKRLVHALTLINAPNRRDAKLVLSGGPPRYLAEEQRTLTEAQALKAEALKRGFPEHKIITENDSQDFVGNAVLVARLWHGVPPEQRPSRIRIVASADPDYLMRARMAFKHAFGSQVEVIIEGYPGKPVNPAKNRELERAKRASMRHSTAFIGSTSPGDHEAHMAFLRERHDLYRGKRF